MKGIKRTTAILVALMLLFGAFAPATARAEERAVEESATREVKAQEMETTETTETTEREPLAIADENTSAAQAAPVGTQKTFTVTKRPAGNPNAPEEPVGEYDTFFGASGACAQGDNENLYIVTMNRNYDIPEDENVWSRSSVSILLRSKEGQRYTLKRLGTRLVTYVPKECELETQNIIFDGNNDGEFTFISEGGKLTLGKGTVVQNFIDVPAYDGPAIYLSGNSTLNIEDGVEIRDNEAKPSTGYSGAIYAYGTSTINIRGGKFTNNSCDKSGGVIGSGSEATVNISGGTFVNNTAKKVGGVINAYGAVNIYGGTFEENKASTGGAVYVSVKGKATIENAIFRSNKANYAGAVFCKPDAMIKNTTFICNEAENVGGALYVEGTTTIQNSTFSENTSKEEGGSIYSKGSLTIEDTVFTSNIAGQGGAVFANSPAGTVAFKNDTFTSNEATELGGAIFTVPATTIEKTTFEKNEAGFGGAICAFYNKKKNKGTELTISESKFLNNRAKGDGGAITDMFYQYAYEIDNPGAYKNVTTDEKTLFQGNTAGKGLFTPPKNYEAFTNLKFHPDSDVEHGKLTKKSLLNNYDINYQNDRRLITYDANGGRFNDGTKIKTVEYSVDENIKIREAPTRRGYTFTYWKGSEYRPGDDYTVKDNHTFIAQWEKEEKPPKPPIIEKIIVDPNGGTFSDGATGRKIFEVAVGKIFHLPAAPTREGYKFIAWKGTDAEYQPGYPYVVKSGGETFVAVWEGEEEPKPAPMPIPRPYVPVPRVSLPVIPTIPKAGAGK